ncbi:MAG: hypothetical protein J0I06_20070 [Planctomycetes bacterium]|nr:hypothetical protein [Planctomycetota bacterium]
MARFACLLFLTNFALAAPIPKGAGTVTIYYPTTAGAKWVYVTPDGDEQTIEVADVKRDGGDVVVSLKGDDAPPDKIIVSADGLRYVRDGTDGKLGGVMMKAKFREGDSWKLSDGSERTISGPEVVEVPAGKFTAVKVTVTVREFDQIIWYAPGVGEVKRTVKKNGVEAVMRSLKSFADGKK